MQILQLVMKVEKALLLSIQCGFNLNDLMLEPEKNVYVQQVQQMISKLQFYILSFEKVKSKNNNADLAAFLETQTKTFLVQLQQIQSWE